MLHLTPAPLHRALYRLADAARQRWWRIRKPRRSSVIVAAFDGEGRVMLVRHSYGKPAWLLPGGGIDRGEDPARAVRREIREELGCGLAELMPLTSAEIDVSGSRDLQHLFCALVDGEPRPDMREIVAVAFFDPDHLPASLPRRAAERVAQAAALRRASQQR